MGKERASAVEFRPKIWSKMAQSLTPNRLVADAAPEMSGSNDALYSSI